MAYSKSIVLACAAGLSVLAAHKAQAQPLAESAARPITVSVNYNINLPLRQMDAAAQTRAMESGRKMLYRMAVSECAVMLQTIATRCALSKLNVQSNLSRTQSAQTTIRLSASAQYSVGLKPGN
ncbi:MAG: hypothetical protein AB7O43_16340 [Hyphomicrobiaceae bacterium]